MALTDTAIRKAKPGEKPVKLTDEKGLDLLLNPNGSRGWRFDCRFDGKRKSLFGLDHSRPFKPSANAGFVSITLKGHSVWGCLPRPK
jgi:hypothetical protein